ncbi:MAG: 3-phosphoshikimate 1-carboxyvinyltransferase [Candidatus Nephthysia bennettiae]|uniref:3-phosphoshikimate 1-carboxyvinyltransferase n=1 Tax=Candidatus Nephthysia bennettiae TaxID=3127016 RepID=A0A934ND01_9BACT|nr:3-phosphoshikimate 1-carboxyvinyltransferase [Candidatus Dormibacteraeota bacterium]MBJ7611706.1 3-phosphoshikimate 1-carboxyvinyltransferase [Candidatus Dormibacteraeota bacterium]PZR88601.1 MAG: 3-phosphoshikimate 1-carboxyvinyltransferase [Candidatus Dormibacteraeota bacterium]
MLATVRGTGWLGGRVTVPGDKSISHRALIFNAIAGGEATVNGLSTAADVGSTASCLRALGVEVEDGRVRGAGLHGLRPASGALDCGNSGTTMRLLAGLLAAQPFSSTLVGDASLSARPMERLTQPLRLMGARVESGPLRVGGGGPLAAIDYASPVSSAQVKTALLLAGLYAEGTTRVEEPAPSRDHSERMLRAMGAAIDYRPGAASVVGPVEGLCPLSLTVPGDLSAAAFWLVAGGLSRSGRVQLSGVGVNPSRTALLHVLRRVGLAVHMSGLRQAGEEPVADLEVGGDGGEAQALDVEGAEAALLIDELPVLAVAAAFLPRVSRITGAAELRVKESDRIAAMAEGLTRLGARVSELPDGWEIRGGGGLVGARVSTRGDHRVAMALAVAGLLAEGETEIDGAECVAVSYPKFWDDLELLCSR